MVNLGTRTVSLANRRIRRQIALDQFTAWQITRLSKRTASPRERRIWRQASLSWARRVRPYLLPNGSIPDV